MAGSAVVLGLAGGAAALTIALSAVAAASVFGQRLAGAADASALAAADAASGAVTGIPCDRAAEVAHAAGVSIDACQVDGLIATVTVSARFGGIPAAASARAGPPT